ncbi:MAG: hypothetical protein H6754_06990 [Candidatus Omnitrophica bacterium]|nr:hypothetical protein [Candidatus Omnitrophota bacterium]
MDQFSLKNSFCSVILAALMLTTSGCIYLAIGGVGVVGGYAISPDTVEGNVGGNTFADVWAAAVETVSIMGVIEEKNDISGVLIAKVQNAHVTVTISEAIADNVKLRVKARRGMMPKIKLAQDIYTKIVQRSHP